ncbi:hypothetical protein SKAU_G00099910 [Synaphobranchus kaupii]|uniref:Uncharacterized protein n=1 Tax=Synaphobranchus kaupii TaxID=118154 RepID=A0A9Q1J7C4_SYNKA|nr:hypothetical protein SKAU_G00099910 [Synaphobranchus kaupii]
MPLEAFARQVGVSASGLLRGPELGPLFRVLGPLLLSPVCTGANKSLNPTQLSASLLSRLLPARSCLGQPVVLIAMLEGFVALRLRFGEGGGQASDIKGNSSLIGAERVQLFTASVYGQLKQPGRKPRLNREAPWGHYPPSSSFNAEQPLSAVLWRRDRGRVLAGDGMDTADNSGQLRSDSEKAEKSGLQDFTVHF